MFSKICLLLVSLFYVPALFAQPLNGVNYLNILKRGAAYDAESHPPMPDFTYQSSHQPELVALRKNFKLDSVAGFGNEPSRLLNILHWVHNIVKHDGQHESGIKNINATEILNAAIAKHTGVSCGELATTLNDCYLAMGWASRKVYCFPKDSLKIDHDSHVINIVYCSSIKKWIWVDPTNDAYVMDNKGELLSIEEVRDSLIKNDNLIVNPDANWNHRISMTKDYYLDTYMAKNLYRFYCPLNSEYNYETFGQNKKVIYVYLNPLDYQKKPPFKTDEYYNPDIKTTFVTYNIHNEAEFWKAPRE